MGLEELIKTLKKNEQEQIEDIWQQARKAADSLRQETAAAICKISEEHDEQLNSACQKSVREIFADAQTKARQKKLLAYRELDSALYTVALRQLPTIRVIAYEDVFAQLVAELPDDQWEQIVVNPSDLGLASKFFDENIVHQDAVISGGLIASSCNGRIVINNTFEKRLERKWPQILPELIQRIETGYEKSKTA